MLRYTNEYGAQLVRDHPGRFGLLATLPLADIDGSLRELEYAFDVLAADGVNARTSYGALYPGNPHFDPIFAELDRRKAAIVFHPTLPASSVGLLPDVPGPTVEYQFDTARAITNLLFTGTLSKYPDIKYIFCHAGGALIPQVGRVVRHATDNKTIAARLPNGPWAEIRKLHFDTAQAANPWNFGATRSFMPISQVLLGSDYPFVPVSDTMEPLLSLGLTETELSAVTRDNALRLFPRLQTE
jgi:predicted TIM-barrel fold metal-dependent hydrolase